MRDARDVCEDVHSSFNLAAGMAIILADRAAVRAEVVEEAAKAVPFNWLDSLLTGPDCVNTDQCSNPQIENLLNRVRQRILAMKGIPDA